jgi:hypothetical protein
MSVNPAVEKGASVLAPHIVTVPSLRSAAVKDSPPWI